MIQLIYKDGRPVGWEMHPTTDEEQKLVAIIRDLQFFGFGETKIKYNGITLIDPEIGKEEGNVKCISWIQEKYHKSSS